MVTFLVGGQLHRMRMVPSTVRDERLWRVFSWVIAVVVVVVVN